LHLIAEKGSNDSLRKRNFENKIKPELFLSSDSRKRGYSKIFENVT
jgi:hypothetical protein